MKIVCFGSNNRGLELIEYLSSLKKFTVSLVVTERRCARIISFCRKNKIKAFVPRDINGSQAARELAIIRPDLFLIFSFSQILKPEVFNIPRLGTFNCHGGKLPQYRGSSVLNWQIINGEERIGVAIIKVDGGIDTGPVAFESKFRLSGSEDINDAHKKSTVLFKEMVNRLLTAIEKNKLRLRKQDDRKAAYYCHRVEREGEVNFRDMTARYVHNMVRALTIPFPCAYAKLGNKKIFFIKTELPKEKIVSTPGKIARVYQGGVLVACKDRCINFKKVMLARENKVRLAKEVLPLDEFFR